MAKLYNLARMTTATTGTGTITLGSAVSSYLSFASSGVQDGDTVTYAIADGTNREIGRGVYTASGTTLTRTVLESTNSNTAINLSGSAEVFITAAGEDITSDVQITGGSISGITDLAIADGGTGASTAADARTNLGLGTLATQSGTFSGTSSGTNTGDQNIFSTIAVSGQSNVVSDTTSDTLTLVAGSNITITTNASTDTITISTNGGTPSGTVVAYAGSTAPSGWLLSFGQTVSRTTYADLFTAIGTTYGAGDGSTTFALPDLRGRATRGVDNMGGTAANRITAAGSGITGTTLGAAGGAETHTLTKAEMPSHTHSYTSVNFNGSQGTGANGARNSSAANTVSAGSGQDHNNTGPSIMLNYIIKT